MGGALPYHALKELAASPNFLADNDLDGFDQRSKTFQRHIWVFKQVPDLPTGESIGEGLDFDAVTNKEENMGRLKNSDER